MVLSSIQHNTLLQLGWKDVKVNLYKYCIDVDNENQICDMIIIKSLTDIILIENIREENEWVQQELKFSNLNKLLNYLESIW